MLTRTSISHWVLAPPVLPLLVLWSTTAGQAAAATASVVSPNHVSTTPIPVSSEQDVSLQAVPQLLASIEDRLKGLGATLGRGASGGGQVRVGGGSWAGEAGTESLSRRLENFETRLGRLDTLIELRLDKLVETISSRHIKEELGAEQLGRKLDSAIERINMKLGFLEDRINLATEKINARLDALPHEIQKASNGEHTPSHSCCHQLQVTVSASERRITQNIERILSQVRSAQSTSTSVVHQSDGGPSRTSSTEHSQNISRALKDVFKSSKDKTIDSQDSDPKNLGLKVSGMCGDLWRRTQGLEELVKQSIVVNNDTQRQVHDAVLEIARNLWREPPAPQKPDTDVEELVNRLQRRLNDVGRQMQSGFQMMIEAQNGFSHNCHRLQLGERQLEEHLSFVLNKMLDAVSNKTNVMDRIVQDIRDIAHSQSSQMHRSLGLLRHAVSRSTDQYAEDSKSFAKALEQLGDLTEEGLSQVIDRTPTAENIANLIVLDLKPLLLSQAESCNNQTQKNETNSEVFEEEFTDDNKDELTEEDTKTDETPLPLDNFFSSLRNNDEDGAYLWRSIGDNGTFTDIFESARKGQPATTNQTEIPTQADQTIDNRDSE